MEHSRLLVGLMLAALLSEGSLSLELVELVEELEDKVLVNCNKSNVMVLAGTVGSPVGHRSMDLGKHILDPRGLYKCNDTYRKDIKVDTVQVHYRMCQSCVELNPATLAGLAVADVITTLLLALGVYCFAGHETGRLSRAADRQALLRNEQLYQPLRDRSDAQYSHLGESWPQKK